MIPCGNEHFAAGRYRLRIPNKPANVMDSGIEMGSSGTVQLGVNVLSLDSSWMMR